MKKTQLITLILVSVFTITILAPTANAGSTQKHRWEGVAIGIGVALLGNALIKQNKHYLGQAREPVRKRHPAPYHDYRYHRGHWEVRKEWIPPEYKKVWNPGHYNKRGRWVKGHWIEIVDQPGCWVETRVWVTRR